MPQIETPNEVFRKRFAQTLSYRDISRADLFMLMSLIERELESHDPQMKMRISKRLRIEMAATGIRCAFLYVDGSYFREREAVSFNRDGFIGIAGWADSKNTDVIIRALYKWADLMDERKAAAAPVSPSTGEERGGRDAEA